MRQVGVHTTLMDWREALAVVVRYTDAKAPVTKPLAQAHDLIAAEDVVSPYDLPLFASSAMDGYAVCANDVAQASPESPVELEVIGEARAGLPYPGRVRSGQAVEIMTGSPIPEGADAVVKIEDTQRIDDRRVRIFAKVPPLTAIRAAGRDIKKGDVLIRRGQKVTAGLAAFLAAAGIGEIEVIPPPRVGIVVTGDELLPPDAKLLQLDSGAIFDANSVMLELLSKEMGADVVFCERVKDDPSSLREVFVSRSQLCDILVFSGGVSKGRYDFVRPLFSESGGQELFWGINQQPGKPLFFGKLGDVLVLGLPGNPVSAFFCADLYLRTAVRRMRGEPDFEVQTITVLLGEEMTKNDTRVAFRRAFLRTRGKQVVAYSAGPPDSHLLHTIARHHGYVIIPAERARVREGEPVEFILPDISRLPRELLKTLLSIV